MVFWGPREASSVDLLKYVPFTLEGAYHSVLMSYVNWNAYRPAFIAHKVDPEDAALPAVVTFLAHEGNFFIGLQSRDNNRDEVSRRRVSVSNSKV